MYQGTRLSYGRRNFNADRIAIFVSQRTNNLAVYLQAPSDGDVVRLLVGVLGFPSVSASDVLTARKEMLIGVAIPRVVV